MKIKEGEKIPSVDFFYINESGAPEKIKSSKNEIGPFDDDFSLVELIINAA